jgi:hypothetical protein
MRSSIASVLLIPLIIILLAAQTMAVPPMPMEFYGSVFLDGAPAPVGSVITAEINGVEKGNITTTIDGFYGGPGIFDYRLKVFVKEEEYQPGALTIVFKINSWQATQTAIYEPGAAPQLDLSSGEGVVQPVTQTQTGMTPVQVITPQEMQPVDLDISGSSQSDTNTITYGLDQNQTFKAEDGLAEVTLEKDTMLFSPDGQFLNAIGLRAKGISDLPPFPASQSLKFSGYAYEIIPEGTYFNPKGLFTFKLPSEKAFEIINAGPVVYEYRPQTASWEPVNTASNLFTNSITANVFEAAIYALFIPVSAPSISPDTSSSNISSPASAMNLTPPLAPGFPGMAELSPNQTPSEQIMMPVITPQQEITPGEIITPLPGLPTPTEPTIVETIISGPSPAESVAPDIRQGFSIRSIPGLNAISTIITAIQSKLTGPVLAFITFFCIIIAANVIVFVVYREWWQKRGNNG